MHLILLHLLLHRAILTFLQKAHILAIRKIAEVAVETNANNLPKKECDEYSKRYYNCQLYSDHIP